MPHVDKADTDKPDAVKDQAHKPLPAWRQKWQAVPAPIRKTVVLTIGLTLLAIGGILMILPGPFTLPFVFAAIAVLSSEFVWAAKLMHQGKRAAKKAKHHLSRVPKAALGAGITVLIAGVAASAYWVLT